MEPPVDSSLYSDIIFLVISLAFLGLLAFLETSITALRLFRLKEMARETSRYKKLFEILQTNPNRILITILVASNLANVTVAALSSQLMERLTIYFQLPERIGFAVGIGLTTLFILISELIPKNIAKAHGEKLFKSTLWLTNILYYALYPFVQLISMFSQAVIRWVGEPSESEMSEALSTEKEIQFLIDYINEKGLIERHKTFMLKSIFKLGTTPIKDIMVPENLIISINANSTQKETLEIFSKYQFTRLPVFEGEADNIIGMLHQKDFFQLLYKNEDKPLREIVRPIMFIPESAKVLRVLKEFREQRMHIAMVLNEFGGITGLVTLEDVIEEIVGEISDEYESVPQKIIALPSGGWLIDASIELKELTDLLGITFEIEDALTLGGFLTEQLQHVPKKGEVLSYKNYTFQVQKTSPKKVFQVLVYPDELASTIELE